VKAVVAALRETEPLCEAVADEIEQRYGRVDTPRVLDHR